jgi:hypothetical protein
MGLKSSTLADLYWKQPHLTMAFAGQKYIYLRIPICSSSRKRCRHRRNAEEFHQYQAPMKQRIKQKGRTVTTTMELLFTLFKRVHIMILHLICFWEAFPSA